MWSELSHIGSLPPPACTTLGVHGPGLPPNPPLSPDFQYVPCPFPQLLLPRGLVGSQREECLAPSQGRCPGRREAVRTRRGLLRIPAPTSLLGACQSGAGSPGEPLHRSQGGYRGSLGKGWCGGCGAAAADGQSGRGRGPRAKSWPPPCPDGKTEAPWCQTPDSWQAADPGWPVFRGGRWGAQPVNRHHTSREEEGCLSGRLARALVERALDQRRVTGGGCLGLSLPPWDWQSPSLPLSGVSPHSVRSSPRQAQHPQPLGVEWAPGGRPRREGGGRACRRFSA